MQWDRSNTFGLARVSCVYCKGEDRRSVWKTKEAPCNCVFRAAFRACLNRFRLCAATESYAGAVSLDFHQGCDGRRSYSRKKEEYMADFCLVAKRTLDRDEHRVFRFHFLLGADWKLCCRQLAMDKGTFFHFVYRIERKLGRTFAELQPYPLYPVEDYFAGCIHRVERSVPAAPPLAERWHTGLLLSA